MEERQSLPEEPQRNEWVGIVLRTLVAVLVLGGGYYAAAQYLGGRIPSGTHVAGVDIGGLSPEAAREHLESRLSAQVTDEIPIEVEGDRIFLDPTAAGLTIDLDRTLSGITEVSYDPRVIWERITDDGDDRDLVVDIDRAALERTLEEVAPAVAEEPREGTVWIELGEVHSTEATSGQELDVPATADAVAAVWPDPEQVTGSVRPVEPNLAQQEIDRFVTEVAGPAVAEPIVVQVDDEESRVNPNQLSRLLTVVESEEHTLSLEMDGEALLDVVRGQLDAAVVEPRNASVELDGGRPVIVPAQVGAQVNEERIVEQVEAALAETGDGRTIEVETTEVEPEITDEDAQAWEFGEMATFRSEFPGGPENEGRTENIRVGIGHLNGVVVMPGEQFSLADVLAPISRERGYVEAGVISGGRLVEGMGGGLSQVSTVVLNAAWDAGVQLDEWHPHGYYISRYPAGKEATISVGTLDNRFTNDTETPVLIQTGLDGDEIVMTLWGNRQYSVETVTGDRYNFTEGESRTDDSPQCLRQYPQQGFDITVQRVLSRDGSEVDREVYTTHYNPSDEVICTNGDG